MPFTFSFSLILPGITNPFSAPPEAPASYPQPRLVPVDRDAGSDKRGREAHPRRRHPSPSLQPPHSRKRGWVPSDSEISHASPSPASTSGYLDTPAKYRDIMSGSVSGSNEDDIDEMVADLPPAKRRRGLAGSIVSTALSAALIGTAVGLTVYRLWRDRGKQPEALPPPPYEQGEWVPQKPDTSSPNLTTQVTPPTPRRKTRHVAGRRGTTRHRKTFSRVAHGSLSASTSSSALRAPIPPEFNFGAPPPPADDDEGEDDQMSWMNDRLASLIVEGQRALGKEVVIMSEAREDEVDDGADGWMEEDEAPQTSYRNADPPSYSRHASPFPSASPRRSEFSPDQSYASSYARSLTSSPHRRRRDASVESDVLANASFREDESSWQSPELREAMARARQRYRS